MTKLAPKAAKKKSEDRARQLGIQSASIAVIAWMAAYYVVIYFHVGLIRKLVAGPAALVGLWVGFLAFTLTMKGGLVAVAARTLDVRNSLRAIAITSSFYLVGFMGFGGVVLMGAEWAKGILSSKYWAGAHWVWICAALLLLFGLLYSMMVNARLLRWQFITDLKAVPLISPVFCFAGPKLWSDNLEKALFQDRFPIYNALSLTAGCLFLAYWIAFAVFNQKHLDASGKVNAASPVNSRGVKICLGLCALGLYLFLVVLLDILVRLATP